MTLFQGNFCLIPVAGITHSASGRPIQEVLPSRADRTLDRLIRRNGITSPLFVYERKDGAYALISGRKRLAIAVQLSKESTEPLSLPVIVFDKHRWQELSLADNRSGSSSVTSDLEAYLTTADSGSRLEEIFGCKHLADLERLSFLIPEARSMFLSGLISTGTARHLSTLSPNLQKQAISSLEKLTEVSLHEWSSSRARKLPLFRSLTPNHSSALPRGNADKLE